MSVPDAPLLCIGEGTNSCNVSSSPNSSSTKPGVIEPRAPSTPKEQRPWNRHSLYL